MSADRELLELAAKAAGIPLLWGGPDGDMARRTDTWDTWSPLTNDGDALRLAVTLKLEIGFGVINEVYAFRRKSATAGLAQSLDDDPNAATRRAIVRAAAAIGEAMP